MNVVYIVLQSISMLRFGYFYTFLAYPVSFIMLYTPLCEYTLVFLYLTHLRFSYFYYLLAYPVILTGLKLS